MKFRILVLSSLGLILTACNMTLAEDITPPPNYVPPTPVPTLVLYPLQAPNLAKGETIYIEKCAPCHGDSGLGDGPQGIQLSVTVRAFGLSEIARPATPAQYYTMVTRGNIERFMPPFNSLTDQERWDVVGYVLTLHTTPDQIEQGRQLFEKNCAGCSIAYFKDQQAMSALTEVELARLVKQGNDQIKAFGTGFTDDELWAAALYLRSLSFDASLQTPPEAASVNPTPASAEATPVGAIQPPAGVETPVVTRSGFGRVSGTIANETGGKIPTGLTVTLRGFDHDLTNASAGPVEVLTLEGTVNPDGSYAFEDVEIPTNRIFLAEVNQGDITLQTEYAIAEPGAGSISMPTLTLYPSTQDTTALVMDEVQLIFEYGTDSIQVYGIYSFRNPGREIIVVPQSATGEIPFIRFPDGSSSTGFEPTQDSEHFMSTDAGFAIPPSDKAYQLIAFSSIGLADTLNFSQTFEMPVNSVTIFTPVGVKLDNRQLTDLGVQTIQTATYQIYQAPAANAGDALAFAISGSPSSTPTTANANPHTGLVIGAIAIGIALIGAGLWMYRRDKSSRKEEAQEDEFDSADDVIDAIVALDDLHSRKKISEPAYQIKRAQLKEILKEIM